MPEFTPLKIAILSDAIPQRNGAGSYYYDLIENLNEYVKHIELISPGQGGKWDGRVKFPLPGDATQRLSLPAIRKIRKHLDSIKPDIIISATPGPFGLYGKKLARRYKAKFFVGYHTSFEQLTKLFWNPLLGMIIKRYFITINHMLFKKASAVVANSEDMLDNARGFGARSTRLIGTPIPHQYIAKPLKPYPQQIQKILFAGRLSAEKNIEDILDAVAKLEDIQFSVAGDGPLRGDVEGYSKSHTNLTYHGWTERNRLLDLIDQHDLLILPSHVESFGTIALEAMARGRIVLVSEHCGILNWPDLKQGLYDYPQAESLDAAIQRIVRYSPQELELMAQRARHAAIDLNNWNIDDWLAILSHEY